MNKWLENAKTNLLINSQEKDDFNKVKYEWYFDEIVMEIYENKTIFISNTKKLL